MTSSIRLFFGWYFIIWGLIVIFILPDSVPTKFMNYIIIGTYICAILWWYMQSHPWWMSYWLAAAAITCVVTFGNLATK